MHMACLQNVVPVFVFNNLQNRLHVKIYQTGQTGAVGGFLCYNSFKL
jgi:hypothetical protein